MDLSLHDHRIYHLAAIVDRCVIKYLDPTSFWIDFYDSNVSSKRIREIRWREATEGKQNGLHSLREFGWLICSAGDFFERYFPLRIVILSRSGNDLTILKEDIFLWRFQYH